MNLMRQRNKRVADEYAETQRIQILRFLGDGNDGAVWETSRRSAIKVIERPDSYVREREAYRRLTENQIVSIGEFAVPQLIRVDDERRVVEMSIVFPPCLLDFAKAYVDIPPNYSAEVLTDWEEETRELFGDRWAAIDDLLLSLRLLGIYYYDAKPGNIQFLESRNA